MSRQTYRRFASAILPLVAVVLLGAPAGVRAQGGGESCPALVQGALESLESSCADTGRNEACYGHFRVNAVLRSDAIFEQPADKVAVEVLESLTAYGIPEALDAWGIALLRIQADLPDALPGQNVTLLLMGDTSVINQGELAGGPVSEPCQVRAASGANLRSGPGTGYNRVGGASAGDALAVTGQNAAGDWLQLATDFGEAWIAAQLVTNESCDFAAVPAVEPGQTPESPGFAPMQAFTFSTGLGETACAEAPADSLVIRSPAGTTVHLRANGVDIALSSAAVLTARPAGPMTVSVLEGAARVTAQETSVTVLPGFRTTIAMSTDLLPVGPPTAPEPYTAAGLAPLAGIPADAAGGKPLPVPEAGTITQWDVTSTILGGNGTWADTGSQVLTLRLSLVEAADGESLFYRSCVLHRSGEGVYSGSCEWDHEGEHVMAEYTMTFTSPGAFTMDWTLHQGNITQDFLDEGVLAE